MQSLFQHILWEPDGIIIDLGFYQLRWYSLLFATGFIVSYILLKRYFKAAGLEEKKLEKLTVYTVVATVIGARLGHCLFYDFDYYSEHIAEIFLPFRFQPEFAFTGYQGLASHGGTLAVFAAVVLYTRVYQVNLLWLLDKLAIVAALGAGVFIRLGNLMNSEIIGKPADVPWAFVFSRVDQLPRHPGQLYEAISYFLIFLILYQLDKKGNRQSGFVFGVFLVLLFAARFVIEFFKADQSAFEQGMTLNMGQLLSLPLILAGAVVIFIRRRSAKSQPATE